MTRASMNNRFQATVLAAFVAAIAVPSHLVAWQPPRDLGPSVSAPAGSQLSNLARESLVAWCIVPFDAAKRGPEERAKMLKELGLRHLAYDWREEHVPTWDDELSALKKHGIELTAFWCSSSLTPAQDASTQRIVRFLKRTGQTTQLWVMLPDHELAKTGDEEARVKRAAAAVRELAQQVAPLGCKVGLYNHGGWIGKPSSLVKVMQELSDLKNVGIVYNFHHAHEDLAAFPQALVDMRPYLLCLNLNGTTVGGPKILPLGSGEEDKKILTWIEASQYAGPIGILDHRSEQDAKQSLQQNLDGLHRLLHQ